MWVLGFCLLLISCSLKEIHFHLPFIFVFTGKSDRNINALVAGGILEEFFGFLIFPSKKVAVDILFYLLSSQESFKQGVVAVLPRGVWGLGLTLRFEC